MSKERLIGLLKKSRCDKECDGFNNEDFCNGCAGHEKCVKTADYLLANGVIVLPCKVGDTVYFDAVGYHDSAEIDGIHIDEKGMSFTWVQYDVGVDITEVWDGGEFMLDDIGKTVFLTREEAEAKLKEGGKG